MPAVIGRFAPSPTGLLHAGSLVAALGSYLSARQQQGHWHLRIENIDPPREMPGAAAGICHQLEAHGLHWDGDILWQADHRAAHERALQQLRDADRVYACHCSRRDLLLAGVPDCLGPCRHADHTTGAWRLRQPAHPVHFTDRRHGACVEDLSHTCGDVVLMRRDGLVAYQLAVVVDDAALGVTDVVRGDDLLDNTARQVWLHACLGLPTPRYLHLPLVTGEDGRKLSKQNNAAPLRNEDASHNLHVALRRLGLDPPPELVGAPPQSLLAWGCSAWSEARLPSPSATAFEARPKLLP